MTFVAGFTVGAVVTVVAVVAFIAVFTLVAVIAVVTVVAVVGFKIHFPPDLNFLLKFEGEELINHHYAVIEKRSLM